MAPKLYLIFFISMVLRNVFAQSSCANSKEDIIFVLDSSDDISDDDFRNELIFVANFVIGTKNIGKQGKQIGVQSFAAQTITNFFLGAYDNKNDILKAITSIKRLKGNPNSHLALEEVKKNGFSQALGSRVLAHKVVVLITNGHTTDLSKTKAAAKELIREKAEIFAICVGKNTDPTLFLDIASSTENIFIIKKFHALHNLQQHIREATCSTCSIIPKDVIFALDSSTTITEPDFKEMIKFVSDFVLQTALFGENGTQVGVYTFSDIPRLELPLGIDNEKVSFINALNSLKLVKGKTNTNLVLDAVREKGFTEAFGARPNTKYVLITITDGVSKNPFQTIVAAKKLQELKVEIFSIGVGNYININELYNIASSRKHVFLAPNFDVLSQFTNIINDLVCVKMKYFQTDRQIRKT